MRIIGVDRTPIYWRTTPKVLVSKFFPLCKEKDKSPQHLIFSCPYILATRAIGISG